MKHQWQEYILKLFHDNRCTYSEIWCSGSCDTRKEGKCDWRGRGDCDVESAEGEHSDVVVLQANRFHDVGHTYILMQLFTLVAVQKKQGAMDCKNHRTTSVMSQLGAIVLRIINNRNRNMKIPEILEEQCGFVKGKKTTNAVFFIRTLSETEVEMQMDLCLCFIDYEKAFETVRYQEKLMILARLRVDEKDLSSIKNLYYQQKAAVGVGDDLTELVDIRCGVRRVVFCLQIYSLCMERL